jgi:hypothetical protein
MAPQKINLFLTFDYELPLGGWHVPLENALLKPTARLLQLCDDLRVPAVFFVDVLSGIQMRRWGESSFEEAMRRQLQEAAAKGHDLQLHLHPHWLTSTCEGGKYTPSKDFRLADFTPAQIDEMVVSGIAYLRQIAVPVCPDYRCLAFRAGGYNLENSDVIFDVMQRRHIGIDSSLCDGYYYASDRSTVDFRGLPARPNWYFRNGDFKRPEQDGIYEIPIAGKKKSLFEAPTVVKMRFHKQRKPESRGRMIHAEAPSFKKKWRKAMSARMVSFDNYTYSTRFLLKALRYNLDRFAAFEEINLAVISHPKSMDTHNFRLMEDFVRSVRSLYGEQVRFTTFQQFAHEKRPALWK